MNAPLHAGHRAVVLGLGIAGRAVVRALTTRGIAVTAVEDRPTADTEAFAMEIGCELVVGATRETYDAVFSSADCFVPSPGIPEHHVAFAAASAASIRIISEFDIAGWFDDRPVAAITGTDGKTSVTMLATDMLNASGVAAAAVGNTDVPLVEAIDSPQFDVFVVEASSFRLGHSEAFSPVAAAWLNFSPDHLDVHSSLERYEMAKAQIWQNLAEGALVIAPHSDDQVRSHIPDRTDIDVVIVSIDRQRGANAFVENGRLIVNGHDVADVDSLPRKFAHDITNTLFAAAVALRLGATPEGIAFAIANLELAPHRIQFVTHIDGVNFYNDSKATVPHAVKAAVSGFDSVVLIAGGKNKGIDLSELAQSSDRITAVVAIGDAKDDVAAVFDGLCPVELANNMDQAVKASAVLANRGDAVLLSPGCASFDQYESYQARGDDFIRAVREFEAIQ